ncbi:MAG: aldehyde dehydrogenase (NADP(+)), partial [Sphingomonas sp.]
MASVNPVLLFPAALQARAEALGAAYVASLSQGAGQFCTNPGIVLGGAGAGFDRFTASARAALESVAPQVMLTQAIHRHYGDGVAALLAHPGVSLVARGVAGDGYNQCQAALFLTDAATIRAHPALTQELFGAVSLIIRCADVAEMAALVAAMEGQLTVTLQLDEADEPLAAPLVPMLERKAGRLLANGWPTGVEVAQAMVHGGPYPATSDPRTTSVGAAAIERFLRPICYQSFPGALLPGLLDPANSLGVPRLVDGVANPR